MFAAVIHRDFSRQFQLLKREHSSSYVTVKNKSKYFKTVSNMDDEKFTPRLAHRDAIGMPDLMKAFVKHFNLSAGLNTQKIFDAWDKVSGAESFTLNKFFKGGTLYVTVSSSMVRTQLGFQKDSLIKAMNDLLEKDPLFMKDCNAVGYVKKIILR